MSVQTDGKSFLVIQLISSVPFFYVMSADGVVWCGVGVKADCLKKDLGL